MRAQLRLDTVARMLPWAWMAALVLTSSVRADPLGSYGYLIPVAGYAVFDQDLLYAGGTLADHYAFGGRAGYQPTRHFGFEIAGGIVPTRARAPADFDVTYRHGSVGVTVTPISGRYVGPFVFIGGGAARIGASGNAPAVDLGNAELGAGVQLWPRDDVGLRLEVRDLAWLSKKGGATPESHVLSFSGGLTIPIGGKSRDSDGDGVLDRIDRCPDTPRGATVDATGCPRDSDGDGVPDGLDRCAGTPRGATVDTSGCPRDSDGDGVLDGLDRCPGTRKGVVVDSSGCARDADGDGVPDGLDRCPETAPGAAVDADGCPLAIRELEDELARTGTIRLVDLPFDEGRARLRPQAFPTLDAVGCVLVDWPDLKWEIGGHTDARGSRLENLQLSEARAIAVLYYLLRKFKELRREQFTVRGYGGTRPLVPGKDPANVSKNRRIEFKVLNPEALQREITRRKLMQIDPALRDSLEKP